MSIEIITIIVYMLLMLGIGIAVQRLNTNVSDYFRNGCRGQWWLVGASAFMCSFSAWTFTGAAGVAYTAGWSVMVIFIANFIGFLLGFLFLAPWFRQLRATTGPEVIRDRFGVTTQQFYAWISIPNGLFYSSLHLYGLAIFSSAVFGLPINWVIIGVGLVVLVYATTGGSWAVMSSDFLQFLILMPMTLLLAYLGLKACGGVGGFIDLVHQKHLETDFQILNSPDRFSSSKFSLLWALAIGTQLIVAANTLQSSHRYFAVKDGREARKAALLGGIMMLLGSTVWFLPPMVGRLLFEDQINAVNISTPAEAAYAITSMKLLPVGMTGLMVVAMFSATMSSMDSGLNRNAAVFTKDIYPALCRLFGKQPLEDKA
jgi:SSS family transporter